MMNAFNTFFKSPFKASKPHLVQGNKNHDVDHGNHANSSEISKLSYENQILNDRLKSLTDRLRRVDEQSSRHRALYEKARFDLLKIEDDCREQVKDLHIQVNSTQRILQNISDHECIAMMRQVRQNLDKWINGNFKDGGKIDTFLTQRQYWPFEISSRSIHQKRMSIQAHASSILCKWIFDPYSFTLAPHPYENDFLLELEQRVYQKCSMSVWQNYRFGTNEALETFERDHHAWTIDHIVEMIENELGDYSSTEKDTRQSQLRSLVARCMDFKKRINQQQCIYRFQRSEPGEPFDLNLMAVADGAFYPRANIAISLWPALLKGTPLGGSLCLETELVLLAYQRNETDTQ